MPSNLLFEKAPASDTAKLLGALVKLLLQLYAGPTAIALGAFLEKVVLTGVESWRTDDPALGEEKSGTSLAEEPPQVEPVLLGIGEVLSFFGIKSIEIEPNSLLQLLDAQPWSSESGGVSAIRDGSLIKLALWFDPARFPAALNNAAIDLSAADGTRRLHFRLPAIDESDKTWTVPQGSQELQRKTVKTRIASHQTVTIAVTSIADTRQRLLAHGIRLSGSRTFNGYEVMILCEESNAAGRRHVHLLLDTTQEKR